MKEFKALKFEVVQEVTELPCENEPGSDECFVSLDALKDSGIKEPEIGNIHAFRVTYTNEVIYINARVVGIFNDVVQFKLMGDKEQAK